MDGRYRVFIVDDDPSFRELLAEVFASEGYEVHAAGDADGLPDSWRGDVVIMDTFASPYRSAQAVEAVETMRRRIGAGIVVVTAHGEASDDAQRLGDAFVSKPFELDVLLRTVRRVAERQRLLRY
jgi:CheY-like chemotaxis protein